MSTYQDLDISFSIHPYTKDILVLEDVSAVKFALKMLLLTSPGENISDMNFGCGIEALQFELLTPPLISYTKKNISNQINNYLPEVNLQGINIYEDSLNSLTIILSYYVVGNQQLQTYNLVFERYR